jgi:hypothetical protein
MWTLDQALVWIATRDHDRVAHVDETPDGVGTYYALQFELGWTVGAQDRATEREPVQSGSEEENGIAVTATSVLSRAVGDGIVRTYGIYPFEQTQCEISKEKLTTNRIIPTIKDGPQLQVYTSSGWKNVEGVRFSRDDIEAAFPPFHKARARRPWYKEADEPLLAEMQELMFTGKAATVARASAMVGSKAVGYGTPESKAKRLARRYQRNNRPE